MSQPAVTAPKAKLLFLVIAMASVLLLSVLFVMMLRPAAERSVEAACRSLRPDPMNNALGRLPAPAPNFRAQDQDGKMVSLSDFRGRVVLVNFWASWCNVCALEKPTLKRLHASLGSDLEIVTLASDSDWGEIQKIFPQGPPFRVLLDPPMPNDNLGRVARTFGVTAVPESFIVDKNGVAQDYYINRRNWNSAATLMCLRSMLDNS